MPVAERRELDEKSGTPQQRGCRATAREPALERAGPCRARGDAAVRAPDLKPGAGRGRGLVERHQHAQHAPALAYTKQLTALDARAARLARVILPTGHTLP